MPPKVSVNICCYNSEKYIKETIQSVLDQTFHDFEIIIIDDGSRDRTGEIIKSFIDWRIKYFYQDNRGLSISRNRAIDLSQGTYIALIDHDDCWEPDKLKLQVELLEKNSNVGLVYSDAYIVDQDLKIKGRFFADYSPHRGKIIMPLLNINIIPCLTAVFRRELIKTIGGFDPTLAITEDYDFFLRIAFVCDVDFIDAPLAKCRLHSNNTTGKHLELLYKETIKILLDYDNTLTDPSIKTAVADQLLRNYRMLALYYLKSKKSTCLNKEVGDVIRKERNLLFKITLLIFSCLPLRLRGKLLECRPKTGNRLAKGSL